MKFPKPNSTRTLLIMMRYMTMLYAQSADWLKSGFKRESKWPKKIIKKPIKCENSEL